jgi:ribosomal protein S18 acetylase RimI-like enzyme
MTFTMRAYESPNDLTAMLALTRDSWRNWQPYTHYHVGDLSWRLRNPDYETGLRLWFDDTGRLAGFSEFANGSLDFQVHPDYRDVLEPQILTWTEEESIRIAPEDGSVPTILTWANPGEAGFIALLESRGYQREEAHFCTHIGLIAGDIPEPPLPEGYRVRHLRSEEEIEARVQAHRDGWQTNKMTVEAYRRLMAMPGYRPELDIVAVAPDDTMVACCNCWIDEENRVGEFEPVATHASYRQMGMGRAIIRYGQRQMHRYGAHTAFVVSRHENIAARRLYAGCGMPVVRREYRYTRIAGI